MNPVIIERVLDLATAIHQIPSPTFNEGKRAEYIRNHFFEQEAKNVSMDKLRNVYVPVKGQGEKAPVVVTARLDTVCPAGT